MPRALRAIALVLSSALLAPLTVGAQATTIEILTLKNRRPEDLVPTLAPLAGPGGAVTAHGGRLIVRAGPAEMARIKATLLALDGPARMVSVSVRQVRERMVAAQSASATAEGRAGAKARVPASRPAPGGTEATPETGTGSTTASASQGQAEESRLVTQVLQITEGASAFIEVGSVKPVAGPAAGTVGSTSVETATGFFAIPRLTEDGFTLEISAHQENVTHHGGVEGTRLSATISGALGAWIPLGRSLREQARATAGPLSTSVLEAIDLRSLELRVDAVR